MFFASGSSWASSADYFYLRTMCNGTQRCECFSIGEKKMETPEGIDKLFFELASESRIGILRKLNEKNWKMNSLARKLELTTTETFRQLQRLKEALLVEKQPDGAYSITAYGKYVLQLSATLEFVFKHKQYFMAHDLGQIPRQFMNRIGELSETKLIMILVESTTNSSTLIGNAKQFMWGISPEPMLQSVEATAEQIPKGVEYRVISPQPPVKMSRLEIRSLADVPVIMAVTEAEASVLFRFLDGRIDYASFYGSDPQFLSWTKDLFLYYWDKAKRI
jgi:predicted transcriptional regulator